MAPDAPRWHPILATVEGPLGTWRMIDSTGREYGLVRLVRLDGVPRYRAELAGSLLGYGTTLRGSCERVHAEFIRAHGPGGEAGRYPDFRARPAPGG